MKYYVVKPCTILGVRYQKGASVVADKKIGVSLSNLGYLSTVEPVKKSKKNDRPELINHAD
jgi:hypothetical protein